MTDLNPARRDEIVERVAQKVQDWGLLAPAVFFLEANRPLGLLGGQLLLFAQPLLGFFVDDALVRDAALLLEEPQGVERLIARLEELARTGSADEH